MFQENNFDKFVKRIQINLNISQIVTDYRTEISTIRLMFLIHEENKCFQ